VQLVTAETPVAQGLGQVQLEVFGARESRRSESTSRDQIHQAGSLRLLHQRAAIMTSRVGAWRGCNLGRRLAGIRHAAVPAHCALPIATDAHSWQSTAGPRGVKRGFRRFWRPCLATMAGHPTRPASGKYLRPPAACLAKGARGLLVVTS